MTYDLWAVGNYISERNRKQADLPILWRSTKRVGVANSKTSTGMFLINLPFPYMSNQAVEADILKEFPTSLMSLGKTADDGNVPIFTKDGVFVH